MITVSLGGTEAVFALTDTPQSITSTFGKEAETVHNFTWITSKDINSGVIEYCAKDEFAGFNQKNIQTAVASSYGTNTDTDSRMVHKVELRDLKPGTDYVYHVGITGSYGPQGVFRTAGNEPYGFSFINITDTQGSTSKDYAIWKNTLDVALGKVPQARFLIHTGDMVDDGQKISQWNLFTGAVANELINLPIVPTLGNHDVLNSNNNNTCGDYKQVHNSGTAKRPGK